ncbi:GFA family protein [bacterium]|nr:GFA family protein [bacterium]
MKYFLISIVKEKGDFYEDDICKFQKQSYCPSHSKMSATLIEGKCHCGLVKYKLNAPKQFEFFCHCQDCRVLNGGGHLSGAIFDKSTLIIDGGPTKYSYPGGSGKNIDSYFCPVCGTSLYAFPLAHPGLVVLRANSMKDDKIFTPQKSIFPESAFKWDNGVI